MANVAIRKKDSILDQVEQMRRRIEHRAYELFRRRDGRSNDPIVDWLTAEQEMFLRSPVEVREKDGTFTVVAALPGFEAKDVSVDVTAHDVAIKGETTHAQSRDEGQVHYSELTTGELFRSVCLPKPVDSAKAKAEYRNGLLTSLFRSRPRSKQSRRKSKRRKERS